MSKYIGESEKGVRELFKKARQAAPAILFLDEIDSICPRRNSDSAGSGVADRVISQFLTEMDGIEDLKGVVVLAATNRIDMIDPALLRSGRFDLMFELPRPNEKTREKIFEIHTRNKPLHKNVNVKKLAKETENFVGADIEFVCRKASVQAIRETIEKIKDSEQDPTPNIVIKEKHFDEIIELVKQQNLVKS